MSESPPRPTWDEFFCALVTIYSARGTCDRSRVGCLFVKENRIVSAGYNGSLAGTPHCDDDGHVMEEQHCIRTSHAEDNGMSNRDKIGASVNLSGSTAYVTISPCFRCFMNLLHNNVKRIVYIASYGKSDHKAWMQKLGIKNNVEIVGVGKEFVVEAFKTVFERLNGPGGLFKDENIELKQG